MNNTYAVYSMTPKGSFSQKYEGALLDEANQVYSRLEKANKPRNLTKREGNRSTTVVSGGGFPND